MLGSALASPGSSVSSGLYSHSATGFNVIQLHHASLQINIYLALSNDF